MIEQTKKNPDAAKDMVFVDVSKKQQRTILGKLQNTMSSSDCDCSCTLSCDCDCSCTLSCDCDCSCTLSCDCDCSCTLSCDCDCSCR